MSTSTKGVSLANFNPLFPYGKRHFAGLAGQHLGPFQSTLPIREETVSGSVHGHLPPISIHSSHTGRDLDYMLIIIHLCNFNPLFPYGKRLARPGGRPPSAPISIHSSHTGRDCHPSFRLILYHKFQSTLPIREETAEDEKLQRHATFQSTLPIREETAKIPEGHFLVHNFNPLFPYGKRLLEINPSQMFIAISIHSSHTGRDVHPFLGDTLAENFNPLFPYGKRRLLQRRPFRECEFQSTLPIREETFFAFADKRPHNFNPLFPYGKRRAPCDLGFP